MNLAFLQMRRAPVRTGLLVLLVAVLLFLVEYLAAVSSSLQALNTGALARLGADLVVYGAGSGDSLDASRLTSAEVTAAAHVSGVAQAAAMGVAHFTVTGPGGRCELDLIGLDPGPAWPRPAAGSLPGAGQALADTTEVPAGLGIGRGIVLQPGGLTLRITALATGVRYDGLVTVWTTFASWQRAVRAANPGGLAEPAAVAVRVRAGVPPAALARRLAAALPGNRVLTRSAAVADVAGAGVLQVTFGLLIAVAFLAAVLVTGSVFLLLTVQRARTWVLLRALGASAGRLALAVMAQAVLVVAVACVVASGALAVVGAVSGPGFPLRAAPSLLLSTFAAALIGALASSLLPVRRIGRLDPAAALVRG
ncbi:MAG TPA: FtsX-like permease family protein [Actinocrinis sp.]